MKNSKKIASMLLAAAMVFPMAACSTAEEPAIPDDVLAVSSQEADLFTGQDGTVVNGQSEAAEGYHIDEAGNIVDADGVVVVTAENAAPYIELKSVKATLPNIDGDIVLAADEENSTVDEILYLPREIEMDVALTPANATANEITVVSDNPDVVEVADGKTFEADGGSAKIRLICKAEGIAAVTVKAANGKEARVDLNVTLADFKVNTGHTGWVVSEVANFRASPETGANLYGSYEWGTSLRIFEIKDGWAKVVIDDVEGYMQAKDVSYTMPRRPADPTIPDELDDMITGIGYDTEFDDIIG